MRNNFVQHTLYEVIRGHVGKTATMEQAQVAAKLCALNMLAQLEKACIEAFGVKQGLNNISYNFV